MDMGIGKVTCLGFGLGIRAKDETRQTNNDQRDVTDTDTYTVISGVFLFQ